MKKQHISYVVNRVSDSGLLFGDLFTAKMNSSSLSHLSSAIQTRNNTGLHSEPRQTLLCTIVNNSINRKISTSFPTLLTRIRNTATNFVYKPFLRR